MTEKKKEYKERITVGFYEKVTIISSDNEEKEVTARIDTGATKSSIDIKLASEMKLGPIVGIKDVKSSLGETVRPMVKPSIRIGGKRIKAKFTLSDRSSMSYPVLIGQNVLKMGFIIDPLKEIEDKK